MISIQEKYGEEEIWTLLTHETIALTKSKTHPVCL